MKVVVGNKQKEIYELPKFDRVEIDLGTGDGRFIYKAALEDPDTLFIGIDPSHKQLEIFSKKANKKRLKNILFVVGSIEILPKELKNTADKLYIILPWGSLLESITKPTEDVVSDLTGLLKESGEIEMIFGYDPDFDANADIPEINEKYIKERIIPAFNKVGKCNLERIGEVGSTWGNKLKLREERKLFKIVCEKRS